MSLTFVKKRNGLSDEDSLRRWTEHSLEVDRVDQSLRPGASADAGNL